MKDLIANISQFIKSGEKSTELLGLEVEHFILDENNKSVYYSYNNNKPGVREIIEEMSVFYDKKIIEDFEGQAHLVGLSRNNCEITIEPGAQFEISIKPCKEISEIENIYLKFLSETNDVLKKHNYHLANIGYRPDACALEVPIIPKMRYAYMDANFKNVGKQGFCMMRCSAATQISIDYKNQEDCTKKMKVATALSPIIYFLLDNSPIFERCKINDKKISPSNLEIPKRMARWNTWNNTDLDRCTSHTEIFENDFNYKKYAEIIANMPKIYTPKNLDSKIEIARHELSMNFFDVRLKNTIEIRPADSMPKEYTFAYVGLIKNLFYNEEALNKLYEIFRDIKFDDYISAGINLQEHGWNAKVYNLDVNYLLNEIINLAKLSGTSYLAPIEKLVKNKICLKDFLNENYKAVDGKFCPLSYTVKNTKLQAKDFNNKDKDFRNFVESRKNSKVAYMNKVSVTGYFSKVFDTNKRIQFEMIVKKTSSIIEKICHEYFNNPNYRKLFVWDEFSEKLINFLPKYKTYAPIARFDIFFDDATGQFEFCEFNTGGSAAMSKVTYACEEVLKTNPYKKLEQNLNKQNKTLEIYDVYTPWVNQFIKIYKDWCENTNKEFNNKFTIGICDFLDNCQLPDFGPFKKHFEKAGLKCEICDIRDLKYDCSNIFNKDGIKLDAIYKRVTLDDLIKFKDNDGVVAMINSVFDENVCPIDWFSSQIVHDKQIFPIMHMEETQNLLNESEKSFIKLHVPQTYILNSANKNNKKFVTNKDEYVIKPISSRDAIDVYVGYELNQKDWIEILNKCSKDNNFIIQKFCKMQLSENVWINPNKIDETLKGQVEQCCNMEGLYCYNSCFGGMYLRQRINGTQAKNFDMTVPVFYETEKN